MVVNYGRLLQTLLVYSKFISANYMNAISLKIPYNEEKNKANIKRSSRRSYSKYQPTLQQMLVYVKSFSHMQSSFPAHKSTSE